MKEKLQSTNHFKVGSLFLVIFFVGLFFSLSAKAENGGNVYLSLEQSISCGAGYTGMQTYTCRYCMDSDKCPQPRRVCDTPPPGGVWSLKSSNCVAEAITPPATGGGGYIPTDPGNGGGTSPIETPAPPTIIPPNVPQVAKPADYDSLCNEGYTGHIHHSFSIYYTMENYATTMSDGAPTTAQASTPHVSEAITNMCVLVPTQGTETTYTKTDQTCDSYYGTAAGTYIGTVTNTYINTSTYISGDLKTTKTTVLQSNDVSQCRQDPSKTYDVENKTDPCASGQVGVVTSSRYKMTDYAGIITYTDWIGSNNCSSPDVDDSKKPTIEKAKSLIANLGLTSSIFNSKSSTDDFLNTMQAIQVNASDIYTFNLVIDDLRSGHYNLSNVSKAIKAYNTAVGSSASYRVKLPTSLDKYIDHSQNSGKAFKSAKLESGSAIVEYYDANGANPLDPPLVKRFSVKIFDASVQHINLE